jgi:hypothetical protein
LAERHYNQGKRRPIQWNHEELHPNPTTWAMRFNSRFPVLRKCIRIYLELHIPHYHGHQRRIINVTFAEAMRTTSFPMIQKPVAASTRSNKKPQVTVVERWIESTNIGILRVRFAMSAFTTLRLGACHLKKQNTIVFHIPSHSVILQPKEPHPISWKIL